MQVETIEPQLVPVRVELTGEEALALAEIGNALYGTDVGEKINRTVAQETGLAEAFVSELTYQLYAQIKRGNRQ